MLLPGRSAPLNRRQDFPQPVFRERAAVMMASIGMFLVSCFPSSVYVFLSRKTRFVGLVFHWLPSSHRAAAVKRDLRRVGVGYASVCLSEWVRVCLQCQKRGDAEVKANNTLLQQWTVRVPRTGVPRSMRSAAVVAANFEEKK